MFFLIVVFFFLSLFPFCIKWIFTYGSGNENREFLCHRADQRPGMDAVTPSMKHNINCPLFESGHSTKKAFRRPKLSQHYQIWSLKRAPGEIINYTERHMFRCLDFVLIGLH